AWWLKVFCDRPGRWRPVRSARWEPADGGNVWQAGPWWPRHVAPVLSATRTAVAGSAFLVGGGASLHGSYLGYIQLVGAVEGVDAVLFLEGVGELCVAVAEHLRVVLARVGQ